MKDVINYVANNTDDPVTKKCLPLLEGKYNQEAPYFYMICQVAPTMHEDLMRYMSSVFQTPGCKGYQCWESQLTDVSRMDILDIINTYRQTVARGTCGSWCETNTRRLVFTLRWNFFYEVDAWHGMSNCRARYQNTGESIFSRLQMNVAVQGEYSYTSFQVETGLQKELRAKLKMLLSENLFGDWTNTTPRQFRRGHAEEVGCAYLVRHSVNITTARGEHVQSGNVAHFGCFFKIISDNELISPTNTNSTNESCQNAYTNSVIRPDALYPSLCTENMVTASARSPSMPCQPDAKYHGAFYDQICKEFPSLRNAITWNEKPYGYFVRFHDYFVELNGTCARRNENGELSYNCSFYAGAECNLATSPEVTTVEKTENNNTLDYNCTLKYEVSLLNTSKECQGWSCDDSQLTDEIRQSMLNSLNDARHIVTQGLCTDLCRLPCKCNDIKYCNIVKLRWHWYLESKAAEAVKNCSTKSYSEKRKYKNSPFLEPSFFEEVSVVFDLPAEGQIKLPDKVAQLFWTNGLNDWEKDGSFRRGNAAWIGCAIVIRPGQNITNTRPEYKVGNGSATHMTCIFASIDEDFVSMVGPAESNCCPTCTAVSASTLCRIKTVKNATSFPYLCTSVMLSNINMSCAVNKCPLPHRKSLAWKMFVEGGTVVEHRNDSRETIVRVADRQRSNESRMQNMYLKKMCKILIFLFLVLMSVLCLVLALLYRYFVKNNRSKK